MSWYRNAYRKIHFDYHTPPEVCVVGRNLDPESFVKKLAEIGCQSFNFFAKDVFGNCYWDTKVGNKHPYLDRDLLGEVVRAAKRYGLRVIAYYNVQDLINAQKHPDWRHKGHPDIPGSEGFYVCFNSPWTEKVFLPELKELSSYDIDGIFFDFLYVSRPCFCRWCESLFNAELRREIPRDINDPLWLEYINWLREINERILAKVYNVVHSINPEILIGVNWAYTPRQPGIPSDHIDYLTLDIVETHCPILEASYHARYFDQFNRPFEIMNTRFLRWWGDWGIKPLNQLLAECATIIANGGTCIIGDHLYVDGSPEQASLELISETFRFIKVREEYLPSKSVPYVAILLSLPNVKAQGSVFINDTPLRGAHRLLVESGIHHDIVTDVVLLDKICKYKLVIIPSQRYLSQEVMSSFKDFVFKGGSLLVTFDSSLGDSSDFMLRDLLGIRLKEVKSTKLGYLLPVHRDLMKGMPKAPIFTKGEFLNIEAIDSCVYAHYLRPYVPPRRGLPREEWLGAGYGSPIFEERYPAITIRKYGRGIVCYIATNVFTSYYNYDNWMLRRLIRNVIDLLIPDKLLEVKAPPFIEVSLRRQNKRLIVHLVNWQVGRTSIMPLITDSIIPISNITFKLKLKVPPKRVKLIPENEGDLNWYYEDGYLYAEISNVKVHAIVVIELT